MIPKGLTCEEVGIYLEVIGRCMRQDHVCAAAILEEAREDVEVGIFYGSLAEDMHYEYGIDQDRCRELIAMDLEEAINFNPADRG